MHYLSSDEGCSESEFPELEIPTKYDAFSDGQGWQSALQSPSNRLSAMYNLSKLTDLTVTFTGHRDTLKVHRLVLAMSSPVFECMLFGPMAEGEELKLPEDPPEAFKWLMQYIYCGTTNLPSVSIAVQVYHLSSKYQMKALSSICSQYLQTNLNGGNLPLIYDTATLLEDAALQKGCSKVISSSAESVLSSSDIGQLSRGSMKHLLQQDLQVNSEVSVFKGIIKWGRTYGSSTEKCEKRKSVREKIEEFLPHVRFLTMSLDEFVEHVMPSRILTHEESTSILMNMKRVKNVPLPKVCSRVDKRRIVFKRENLHQMNLGNYGHCHNFSGSTHIRHQMITDMKVSKKIYLGSIPISSSYVAFNQTWKVEITDPSKAVLGVASGSDPQNAAQMHSTNTRQIVATFDPPVLMTSDKVYDIWITCPMQQNIQYNFSTQYRSMNITGCIRNTVDIEIKFWCFDDSL